METIIHFLTLGGEVALSDMFYTIAIVCMLTMGISWAIGKIRRMKK